jgi:hypothetical protein
MVLSSQRVEQFRGERAISMRRSALPKFSRMK